jgi:ketosteroid isomerase-like protein
MSRGISSQNVEIVRRSIDLFNARDMAAYFQLFHPEVTYRNREDEPDVRLYRGLEEYKGYVAGWLEMFEDLRLESRDFIDRGEQVIAVAELQGRGRRTGAEVRGSYVFLLRLRDGVIVQGREYATTDEALEAAGVSD